MRITVETKMSGGISISTRDVLVRGVDLDSFTAFAEAVHHQLHLRLGRPPWASSAAWTNKVLQFARGGNW